MTTGPLGVRVGELRGSPFRDGQGAEGGIYGLDAPRSPSGYPVFAGVEFRRSPGGRHTTRTFALELGHDGVCDANPDPPRTAMPPKLLGLDFELASRIASGKPADRILAILQPTKLPATRPFREQVRKQASGTGLLDRAAMVAIGDGPRAVEVRAIQAEVAKEVASRGGRYLRGDPATGAMLVEMPAGEIYALVDGRIVSFAVSAAAETVSHRTNQEQREEFHADTFWDTGLDGSYARPELISLWPPATRWIVRRVHVGLVDRWLSPIATDPSMNSGPPGSPGERRLVSMWDCSLTYAGPPLGEPCRPGFPATYPPLDRPYHGAEVGALIAADFTRGQNPTIGDPDTQLALSGIARGVYLHAVDISAGDDATDYDDWLHAMSRVVRDGARLVNLSVGLVVTTAGSVPCDSPFAETPCGLCTCCWPAERRCRGSTEYGEAECIAADGVWSCWAAYSRPRCEYDIGAASWLNLLAEDYAVDFVAAMGNVGHDEPETDCNAGVPSNAGWALAIGAGHERSGSLEYDDSSMGGAAIGGSACPRCRTIADVSARPISPYQLYDTGAPFAGTSTAAPRVTGAMAVFASWFDRSMADVRAAVSVLEGPDPIALLLPEDPGFSQLLAILSPFASGWGYADFSLWEGAGQPVLWESLIDGPTVQPHPATLGRVVVRGGRTVVVPINEYEQFDHAEPVRVAAMWSEDVLSSGGAYIARIEMEVRIGECPPAGGQIDTPRITHNAPHLDDKYRFVVTPGAGECAEVRLTNPDTGRNRVVYLGWVQPLPWSP